MTHLQVEHVEARHAVLAHVSALAAHALVTSAAERLGPSACAAIGARQRARSTFLTCVASGTAPVRPTCEDDDADAGVVPGVREAPRHLLHCERNRRAAEREGGSLTLRHPQEILGVRVQAYPSSA